MRTWEHARLSEANKTFLETIGFKEWGKVATIKEALDWLVTEKRIKIECEKMLNGMYIARIYDISANQESFLDYTDDSVCAEDAIEDAIWLAAKHTIYKKTKRYTKQTIWIVALASMLTGLNIAMNIINDNWLLFFMSVIPTAMIVFLAKNIPVVPASTMERIEDISRDIDYIRHTLNQALYAKKDIQEDVQR